MGGPCEFEVSFLFSFSLFIFEVLLSFFFGRFDSYEFDKLPTPLA